MRFCPHCGHAFAVEAARFCPSCGAALADSTPPAEPDFDATVYEAPVETIEPIPLDELPRYGFPRAVWLSWRELMTAPVQFFDRAGTRENFLPMLGFAMIVMLITSVVTTLEQLAIGPWTDQLMTKLLPGMEADPADPVAQFLSSPLGSVVMLLAQTVLVPLGLVIVAAINHVCLLLLGARGDFDRTFRGVCLSTAPQVLMIVPCLGLLVALVWGFVLNVIAQARLHGIDYWRATVALLLPMVVCLVGCCGLGGFASLLGIFAGAGGSN